MIKSFGQFIKDLRVKNGFTLTDLAVRLNIDSANLCKIENGKRQFDEKKIPALCKVFNLEEKEMKTELLSEKIALKASESEVDSCVFHLAERKVKYFKSVK